jgi:hypothetical protein
MVLLPAFGLLAIGFTSEEQTPTTTETEVAKVSTCQIMTTTPPRFLYDVGTRFQNTITKEALQNAKSVHDIISKDTMYFIESVREVELFWHKPGKDWSAKGVSKDLNGPQLDIIELMSYSSDGNIYGKCYRKHRETGSKFEGYFDHYFTVVPEKQANYEGGKDALQDYLMANSAYITDVLDPQQLLAGKIRFVVSKEGTVSNVVLEASCGYDYVDDLLMKVLKKTPEKWTPAENAKGEKVDQEFVFSFGQVGC